jgi:hypothetical protein
MKVAIALVAAAGLAVMAASAGHGSSDPRPDPPASFASIQLALRAAVTEVKDDLQHESYDAKHATSGVCYNLANNVDAEYRNGVEHDLSNSVAFQLGRLAADIGHVQADLQSLKSDNKVLANDGVLQPVGERQTVSFGYAVIQAAIKSANRSVRLANSYSRQAWNLAHSIATRQCQGQGPAGPPTPIAALSG